MLPCGRILLGTMLTTQLGPVFFIHELHNTVGFEYPATSAPRSPKESGYTPGRRARDETGAVPWGTRGVRRDIPPVPPLPPSKLTT
jgi:hypothetical protein